MDYEEMPLRFSAMEKYLGQPFDGLLGDTIHLKVLAELVADPYTVYRIKDLAKLTGSNPDTISKVMLKLRDLELVKNVVPGAKHPLYRVNLDSKKLLALTLLAYGIMDDRDGSQTMDDAIKHYCTNYLHNDNGMIGYQKVASYSTGGGVYSESGSIINFKTCGQDTRHVLIQPKED